LRRIFGHKEGIQSVREIRERGYTGGPTILKAFLQTLSPPHPPPARVFQRFETRPGEEAQSDWSPYRVPIAQRETIVHAFSLILCYSRRLFVAFFRDERLPTLLWAHQAAFRYHQGLCRRIAYDNQATITLAASREAALASRSSTSRRTASSRQSGRPGTTARGRSSPSAAGHDFLAGRAFTS
jgi:transposase